MGQIVCFLANTRLDNLQGDIFQMETLSLVGLDNVMFADSALPAAYFNLEMKATSGDAANSFADNENDDIAEADAQVEWATSPEELPAAPAGVPSHPLS